MSDYHPHPENHSRSSATIRDFVLGMSDGLTVPFALAAGLSGAVDSTGVIVVAGLAEIVAGAISMGLGGYLAAKTEKEYYESEERREHREVQLVPHLETKDVEDIFRGYGVSEEQLPAIVGAICDHPQKWVDFMMRYELGLEKPDPKRLLHSPIIIGGAYAVGGLVPLTPYMLVAHVHEALLASIGVSLVALFAFGAFKGYFTGQKVVKSALQTTIIGSVAAACAFLIAKSVT